MGEILRRPRFVKQHTVLRHVRPKRNCRVCERLGLRWSHCSFSNLGVLSGLMGSGFRVLRHGAKCQFLLNFGNCVDP